MNAPVSSQSHNQFDLDRAVVLMRAGVYQNRSQLIEQALGLGIEIDAPIENGCSAFVTAVRHRKTAACVRLIEGGADMSRAFANGEAAAAFTIESGTITIFMGWMDAGMDVPGDQQVLHELLVTAVRSSNGATATRRLLDAGLDVQWRDDKQRTALHRVIVAGADHDMIGALVAAGVDVDAEDYRGVRPIHLAARESRENDVRLLLALGASPRGATSNVARIEEALDSSPLMCAAVLDRPDLVLRALTNEPTPADQEVQAVLALAKQRQLAGVEIVLCSWMARAQATSALSAIDAGARP